MNGGCEQNKSCSPQVFLDFIYIYIVLMFCKKVNDAKTGHKVQQLINCEKFTYFNPNHSTPKCWQFSLLHFGYILTFEGDIKKVLVHSIWCMYMPRGNKISHTQGK